MINGPFPFDQNSFNREVEEMFIEENKLVHQHLSVLIQHYIITNLCCYEFNP
jgi:hypothetical protein